MLRRAPFVTFVASCLTLAACGGGSGTPPLSPLHVANVTSSGGCATATATCDLTLRFQLLAADGSTRRATADVTGGGTHPSTVETGGDGWGSVVWTFPQHTGGSLTICPAGVRDDTRCHTEVPTGM